MLRLIAAAAASILVALILAACSSSDDGGGDEIDRDSLPENALAESLLLTIQDFPTGFSERPTASDSENECRNDLPAGITGFAETVFFFGSFVSVSNEVIVFATESDLADRVHALASELDCTVDLINDGGFDTDDFGYREASWGALSFPDFGDQTDAVRVELLAKDKNSYSVLSETSLVIDRVAVTYGRIGINVIATGGPPSPLSTFLEDIVEKAVSKLATAE